MTLLPALLAATAVAVWLAVPPAGRLRVGVVAGAASGMPGSNGRPAAATTGAVALHPATASAVAAGAVGLALAGPVAGVLAAGGAVAGVRVLRSRRTAAARSRERARAVEACATLAAELRAGRTPAEALSSAQSVAAGPTRTALAAAASAAAAGADVPAALLAHAEGRTATALPDLLRALAACWSVCSAAGSGLAAAVERLEEGLRAAESQRRVVEAELAGPRATAGLLALLPVAGLVLASGLGADPLHVLLRTPAGLVCLIAGVALDVLGVLWTARLVARAGGQR